MNYGDGHGDSIGVCQVQLSTAELLGFKGTAKQLRDPKINIYYSGLYIKWQLKRYKGDIVKAVSAYNMGSYKESRKYRRPLNHKYVASVFKHWSERR